MRHVFVSDANQYALCYRSGKRNQVARRRHALSGVNKRRTSPLLPRACLLVMKSWTVVSNSSIASRNAR